MAGGTKLLLVIGIIFFLFIPLIVDAQWITEKPGKIIWQKIDCYIVKADDYFLLEAVITIQREGAIRDSDTIKKIYQKTDYTFKDVEAIAKQMKIDFENGGWPAGT